MQPLSSNAIDNNKKLFGIFARKLGQDDPAIYTTFADKFAAWLGDERAYYVEARPEILKILLIAHATLRRNVGVDTTFSTPFHISTCIHHPMVAPHSRLLRAVYPYKHHFIEPDLRSQMKLLLKTITATNDASRSASVELLTGIPPLTSGFSASHNRPSMSMKPSSSSLASALSMQPSPSLINHQTHHKPPSSVPQQPQPPRLNSQTTPAATISSPNDPPTSYSYSHSAFPHIINGDGIHNLAPGGVVAPISNALRIPVTQLPPTIEKTSIASLQTSHPLELLPPQKAEPDIGDNANTRNLIPISASTLIVPNTVPGASSGKPPASTKLKKKKKKKKLDFGIDSLIQADIEELRKRRASSSVGQEQVERAGEALGTSIKTREVKTRDVENAPGNDPMDVDQPEGGSSVADPHRIVEASPQMVASALVDQQVSETRSQTPAAIAQHTNGSVDLEAAKDVQYLAMASNSDVPIGLNGESGSGNGTHALTEDFDMVDITDDSPEGQTLGAETRMDVTTTDSVPSAISTSDPAPSMVEMTGLSDTNQIAANPNLHLNGSIDESSVTVAQEPAIRSENGKLLAGHAESEISSPEKYMAMEETEPVSAEPPHKSSSPVNHILETTEPRVSDTLPAPSASDSSLIPAESSPCIPVTLAPPVTDDQPIPDLSTPHDAALPLEDSHSSQNPAPTPTSSKSVPDVEMHHSPVQEGFALLQNPKADSSLENSGQSISTTERSATPSSVVLSNQPKPLTSFTALVEPHIENTEFESKGLPDSAIDQNEVFSDKDTHIKQINGDHATETPAEEESEPTPMIHVTEEKMLPPDWRGTKLIALQHGQDTRSTINIKLPMPDEIYELVKIWNNRNQHLHDLQASRCFTLSMVTPSLETKTAEQTYKLPSVWPLNGELSMNVLYKGKRVDFPLSPPLGLTPDGSVDLSEFLCNGPNLVKIIQTVDLSKHVFLLRCHPPTPAQLEKAVQRRQKNQEWTGWLSQMSQPLNVPIPIFSDI